MEAVWSKIQWFNPWINFIVSLLLVVERSYWSIIPSWLPVIIALFSGLGLIAHYYDKSYKLRQWASSQIQSLLHHIITDVISNDIDPSCRMRCNIMLYNPKDQTLRVAWHDIIESDAERKLVWKIGMGCTGEACRRLVPLSQDLPETSSYDDLRGPDGQPSWGLSQEHWFLTRHLRSVLCIPIRDPIEPSRLLGALNLDSECSLQISRLGDEELVDNLKKYFAPVLGRFIRIYLNGRELLWL